MNIDPRLKDDLPGGLGKALSEVLLSGEHVVASLEGLTGQGIALTDRRVIIVKAGMASGATFGRKARGFAFEHITSVEFSCGLTEGRVQLTVAGAVEQRQGWMSKRSFLDEVAASRQAETVCQFPRSRKEVFQAMASAIQEALDSRRQAAAAAAGRAPEPSIPEQIRQLAELAQQGILSQEEFESKKRDLLARM